MCDLSEEEYLILDQALTKCHLLNSYVKAGLNVTLTEKNFGFTKMTNEEEIALSEKLIKASKVAWLKEQKGK